MEKLKKNQGLDSIVIGFAVFAIFFGAGNLIFPPYLGLITGTIIQFSVPILTVLYPLIVTLIILTLLNNRIKKDIVFRVGAYMAIIVSLLDQFGVGFIKALPFTSLGLNWILPVIVCCLIVNFLSIGSVNEEIENINIEEAQ